MRVFLTGATGFIGQPLTWAMVHRGWQVTALVRQTETLAVRLMKQAGVTIVVGDVVSSERGALRDAMRGADLVFHNAGWYEVGLAARERPAMQAINVGATETILSLADGLGIRKIVFTSTTTALGDTGGELADENFERRAPALTFYEQTKTEAHALAQRLQARGVPIVIVCPAQVVGPGDKAPFGYFARLYVRGLMPPAAWAPDSVYTMGHVDDVAEAMVLAAEKGRPGQSYILGGTSITTRAMLATWAQSPGGMRPAFWMPRRLAWFNGLLAEPVLRLLGQRAFLSREVIEGSYVCYRYSSAKAEAELGATFRTAEQAWLDTLEAEREARRS